MTVTIATKVTGSCRIEDKDDNVGKLAGDFLLTAHEDAGQEGTYD